MPAIAPPVMEDEELVPAAADVVVAVEVGVDDLDAEIVELKEDVDVELVVEVVGVGVEVAVDEEEPSDSANI